jgi:hypothetical protein
MPIAKLVEETPRLIIAGTFWQITYVFKSGIEGFRTAS